MPPGPPERAASADVTAVLVAHDGAPWLPAALEAVHRSAVSPARLLLVDTGSTDGSADLLRAAGDVLTLPADTGYGVAVAKALETSPRTSWVWLLHDDVAPDPGALTALLAYAADSPSAALLGPKVRDWDDPRLLVEVGLTTDRSGRRHTGLERREHDQGQHDDVRDVLAVGTAGALVRRDVWDEVGGLDPSLPVFRDDLDLGWRVNAAGHRVVVVPDAVVRHARAATTGRRRLTAVAGRPGGIDRRHALHVLLAHASLPALLLLLPRLLLSSLLRAGGFLLTRQLVAARDELLAVAWVAGRPGRLVAARRARALTRRAPYSVIRPLLASPAERLRSRVEAVGGWLTGGPVPGARPLGDAGPEGPDEAAELLPPSAGAWRGLLLRPPVLLTTAATLVALAAARTVVGGGPLLGGRLLPSPAGATDLWASYAASWHPHGSGTAADAHPVVGVLAALSTVLLGKPWLAVDLVLLASLPFAAAAAYAASGALTGNRLLRGWAAATWAVLPVATGGVATGRLDVAAVQVALPLLLLGAIRLAGEAPARTVRRRAWALGLGVGLTAAFAPLTWPVTAAGLAVLGLLARSRRRIGAALIVAAVPAVLLLPWALQASGRAWLDGPGRLLPGADVPSWQLLLLSPGGAGTPARWVAAGLLLAALAALLGSSQRRSVLTAWAVALAGLGAAAGLARSGYWPGLPLQVAGAALLACAVLGAETLRARLLELGFGWRQLAAGALVVAAALVPVAAGLSWAVRGADDPLGRGTSPALPAFARAELAASPGLRALVLRVDEDSVSYDVATGGSPRLGDADARLDPVQERRLDAVVADLVTPRGSDAAEALATRAVRYVALRSDDDSAEGRSTTVAKALDAQPGLTRRASGRVLLWRVVAPTARLTLVSSSTAVAASRGDRAPTRDQLLAAPPRPLPTGREAVSTRIGPGRPGRLAVLAEAADPGWRATFDGVPLARRTAWGWAQAFELPATSGELRIDRDPTRTRTVIAQAAALVVVLVLAAPGARPRRGLEVVDDEAVA